jgi:organic hydroperoxide reductase OsmC/OhrA
MDVISDTADYLLNMDQEGTWGDELMLQAIAAAFKISLHVFPGASLEKGVQYSATYPASAPGPHYGLFFIQTSQHYEILS